MLPWLMADPKLARFIRRKEPREGLRTSSPYVPRITIRGREKGNEILGEKRYRRASWIGFADPKKYVDPRLGIQFQFGFGEEEDWYGIYMDRIAQKAQRALSERLRRGTASDVIWY